MKKLIPILLIGNLLFTAQLYTKYISLENSNVDFSDDILKVRGIVIIDSLGIERAILAAHLPPAQRHGKRMDYSRGVSGLMLYDSEGLERGGYVTDDNYGNIFLTLDSKDEQTALFLAEPQGATTMGIWARTGNRVSFTTSDDEISIDLVENGKKVNIRENE